LGWYDKYVKNPQPSKQNATEAVKR